MSKTIYCTHCFDLAWENGLCRRHLRDAEHWKVLRLASQNVTWGDIFKLLAVIIAAIVVAVGIYLWATRPVVQFSWATQACVKVLFADAQWSCDHLPKRYEVEWVK